jgi:hypothetical protein
MNIWKSTDVEDVPEIELIDWIVAELPDGSRHFIGYNITEMEGRVSSKIITYDKDTKIGITRSGRRYKLSGKSYLNSDAIYVWDYWKQVNDVIDWKDVSIDYL